MNIFTIEQIYSFLVGVIIASIGFIIRNYYVHKYLRKQISQLHKENEQAFFDGLRKGRAERMDQDDDFKIQIRPYMKKTIKTGLFSSSSKADIGIQYQLLIKGIPCFGPHVVIDHSIEQEKVDSQKIKFALNSVLASIQALERGAAGKSISVISDPLLTEEED